MGSLCGIHPRSISTVPHHASSEETGSPSRSSRGLVGLSCTSALSATSMVQSDEAIAGRAYPGIPFFSSAAAMSGYSSKHNSIAD